MTGEELVRLIQGIPGWEKRVTWMDIPPWGNSGVGNVQLADDLIVLEAD